MTKPEECIHSSECSAPLCPLHPEGFLHIIWYADEDICQSQKHYKGIKWISNQRKIARRAKERDTTYYTHAMLSIPCRICTGITGIKDGSNEEKWIESHPSIKPMSEEQKNILRERLKKNAPAAAKENKK